MSIVDRVRAPASQSTRRKFDASIDSTLLWVLRYMFNKDYLCLVADLVKEMHHINNIDNCEAGPNTTCSICYRKM